ncbi:F-box/WD repeat-containing protein 5 [Massospora cicadina]|nr:F-box/WD repeat-containing protein 5 [Massospora cicadina]
MELEPKSLSTSGINQLGEELLLLIFAYAIQPEFPLPVRFVCKKWNRLSKDRMLWRYFFLRDFGIYPESKYTPQSRLRSFIAGLRPDRVDWEKFYLRTFRWGFRPLGVTDLGSVPCIPLNSGQTPADANSVSILERDKILSVGCKDGTVTFYYAPLRPHKRKLDGDPIPYGRCDMLRLCTVTIEELIGISDGLLLAVHLLGEHLALLTQDGVLLLFRIKLPCTVSTQADARVPSLQLIHRLANTITTNTPVAMALRPYPDAHSSAVVLFVALDLVLSDGSHEVAVQEFRAEASSLLSSRYYYMAGDSRPLSAESSGSDLGLMDGALPSAAVTCLAFGGPLGGMLLVTGHGDNTVHVWRLIGDRVAHAAVLFGHTGAISCVTVDDFAPVRVISGARDRRVKVWSLSDAPAEDGNLLMTLEDHVWPLASLATKEDLRLVSGDAHGCWKLWNFDS